MAITVYSNIRQLLTLEGVKSKNGIKINRDDLGIKEEAYIVVENGLVKETGSSKKTPTADKNVDLKGAVVLPAFVDSHTHITFAGSRANEFEMRSEGKTYIEIAKEGGGILSTVNATRKTSLDELYTGSLKNIKRMNKFGVGLIEAKSGYGLDIETEIKQLEAIAKASKDYPFLVPTFLGAHDTPSGTGSKESRKAEFIDLMLKKLIPMVAEKKLAKFCDVFLEDGYYTREETKALLLAAKKHGMIPKIHADEFTDQDGAMLAVELEAASADHLLHISNKGIDALAGSNTVGTILPGTSFNLGLKYAPAKKMIDAGVCLAIASDFNPGSNASLNFQLILAIAITQCKISVAQAIAAGCYGGARALRMPETFGHLTTGANAIFQVYDAATYNDIFYNYGENFLRETIFVQNSAKS